MQFADSNNSIDISLTQTLNKVSLSIGHHSDYNSDITQILTDTLIALTADQDSVSETVPCDRTRILHSAL